ncbi:MAG TPA: hypothetical protein VMT20_16965 [Terriglobia bacterium]|nr:hypothetical protein [Terriglobia bacterium]
MNDSQPSLPSDLCAQIRAFVQSLRQPVAAEEGGPVLQLTEGLPGNATEGGWRLEVEFGKPLLEFWGSGRSIVRRIERIKRDGSTLLVEARKPGGVPVQLEIGEAEALAGGATRRKPSGLDRKRASEEAKGSRSEPSPEQDPAARRARERAGFERDLTAMLAREFPGWRLERVTHRSDRERTFSGCYTRGWAWRGRETWAFLGLSELEGPSAIENALVYGLIWLDSLRERATAGKTGAKAQWTVMGGLKLVLPPAAVAVAAHRAAYLDPQLAGVEILEWTPRQQHARAVDLHDYGNVETRLTARWRSARLLEQFHPLVQQLLGDVPAERSKRVRIVADAAGESVSLRVAGLELARIEGRSPARVYFGLEGQRRLLEEENRAEFNGLMTRALDLRRPRSSGRADPLYRLQPERWLESLLVDDISRVDPAFVPEHVYPQVPAFSGPASPELSRGVIDILGVTRDPESGVHRLAVVELKLDEDPNLPLQGLDYWLRVKWLEDRNQFRDCGYFPGLTPSPSAPVLYLVCPAFRFHSTTGRILRYFQPSIRVVKIGINQSWREGVKVLFRRTLQQGRVLEESRADR